jgi:flagellar export protein FliJ
MPAFVFRAAPVLKLRQQAEDVASRGRAEAAEAVERAQRHLSTAENTLSERLREAASIHDPARREWYRNWIIRQRHEIVRARAMLSDRQAALQTAVTRLNAAHRDVRVLERLRDRLHAAWQLAERRAEQKELDWLATVRHAVAARQRENEEGER